MRILLISLVLAEILLVDDIGLKNTPEGLVSLKNMSNDLQNNYGENVNVIKNPSLAVQTPNNIRQMQRFSSPQPISRLKTTIRAPISQIKSNFSFNPNAGQRKMTISMPLGGESRNATPNSFPQIVGQPKNLQNQAPSGQARVLYPPRNGYRSYHSIIPKVLNAGNSRPAPNPARRHILSPVYFPKNKEPVPPQYVQLNNTLKKEDFIQPDDSLEKGEPTISPTTEAPPAEIKSFNLETSTPEIDKEIDEELFNGDISISATSMKIGSTPSSRIPNSPARSKVSTPNDLSDEIERRLRPNKRKNDGLPAGKASASKGARSQVSSVKPSRNTNTKTKESPSNAELISPFENEISDSKEENLRKVIKTKTKTRKITTTHTTTVTERYDDGDHSNVEPVNIETSTLMPTKAEIKKEQDEALKSVVPRLLGKKFINKHNKDIVSADKARRAYIDYKISESKEKQNKIEKKLDSLKDLDDKLTTKISKLANERAEIHQKAISDTNTAENNESTIKSLNEDQKKTEKLMKLEEVEIGKLEKAISQERNKYQILNDQLNIYKDRLDSLGKKGYTTNTQLKINETKLAEYDRLLNQIQQDRENLKAKIQDIERERRREIDAQNKLEIERKEIEDSNHIPLFAIYD